MIRRSGPKTKSNRELRRNQRVRSRARRKQESNLVLSLCNNLTISPSSSRNTAEPARNPVSSSFPSPQAPVNTLAPVNRVSGPVNLTSYTGALTPGGSPPTPSGLVDRAVPKVHGRDPCVIRSSDRLAPWLESGVALFVSVAGGFGVGSWGTC